MSERDRQLIENLGVSVAKLAGALNKSRQAVNRGVTSEKDYIKSPHLLKLLRVWREAEPDLHTIVRARLAELYPNVHYDPDEELDDSAQNANLFPTEPWEKLVAGVNRISTRQLRENLAETLAFIHRRDANRVIITKNSAEAAAIVSVFSVALLEALNRHPEILAMLQEKCPELGGDP